ncbi:MAG: hypothetical protein JWR42_2946 [Marmoricola sp.]|nr:hypothetical protein [Marmoricola sp.]
MVSPSHGTCGFATAPVGPFEVADLTPDQVADRIVELALDPVGPPATAFALHVGGLLSRRDSAFVSAMGQADIVYADGASVVKLARAAGARVIERSPTTDLGWEVLRGLSRELGRPPVVAVVGGRPGVAETAQRRLVDQGVASAGLTAHGYHDDWAPVLDQLSREPSDVLVLGLGAPLEMRWAVDHLDRLSTGLVLTCGGWLGFLAGEERRAPSFLQRLSLEWAFRLVQSPRRLARRYALGAVVSAGLWLQARRDAR